MGMHLKKSLKNLPIQGLRPDMDDPAPPANSPNPAQVRAAAIAMAKAATPLALSFFRKGLSIETKADDSPVTQADRAVEEKLRNLIAAGFPGDGILGEEYGETGGTGGGLWIIDPIDGTRSFISGHPLFGMLIGRMIDGQMQASVVNLPALSEIYSAARNEGAFFGSARISTSGRTELGGAMLYINEGEKIWRGWPDVYGRLMAAARERRFSYDCGPYALLASGHIDAVVDCDLEPYDYLPVSLLVEEAGGKMTDWEGNPLGMGSDVRVAAAATPELHAELIALLRG
jgi:inositol-phosphate phosphatase/L-galactose 1-phosphate phosphatase/histidinol-phosphatase